VEAGKPSPRLEHEASVRSSPEEKMKTNLIMKISSALLVSILVLVSCTPAAATPAPTANAGVLQSTLTRETNAQVPQTDIQTLSKDNRAFAVDLYQKLRAEDGNLIFSPYSVSLALVMVSAGARNETADQIASAMHFSLPFDQLHPAFNVLDSTLESLGSPLQTAVPPQAGASGDDFQLHIANSIWGQKDYEFLSAFLDLLSQDYGAGMRTVDFSTDPETARQDINNWVSDQTNQKIKDLFTEGTIDSGTRMVLANAIYFKASWNTPFDASATANGDFKLKDGTTVSVPMMTSGEAASMYVKADGYQAVKLPYKGQGTSMIVILPDAGQFDAFEAGFTSAQLDEILSGLEYTHIDLTLPKFKVESSFSLNQTLTDLGMTDAFSPSKADFSGMDGKLDLYISQAIHKAYIAVDEKGTEAAAATGVAMAASAIFNPPLVKVDRPFLFLIYEESTGTILFEGRVLNPAS
jgi:serpin B